MVERVLAVSTSVSKLLTCGLQCSLRVLKLARKLLDPSVSRSAYALQAGALSLKLAHPSLFGREFFLQFENALVSQRHYLSHAPPCSQDTEVGPLDLDFRELLGDGEPDEDADDEKRRRDEQDA